MKNQLKPKSLLKIAMAGLFVFAMAFGVSTTMSVSENLAHINLLALSSQTAQGEETHDDYYWSNDDCFAADDHRCFLP